MRDPQQHWSAWYELEVAACLMQAGYAVEIYPRLPSGRIPDGVVRFPEASVYYDAHVAMEMFPPPSRWDQTADLPGQTGRAIRNLLDKYRQLPEGELGVLVMSPTRLLVSSDIRAALDQAEKVLRPGQRTRIAGIILANKTPQRSGFIRAIPTAIVRLEPYGYLLERMVQALA